MPAHTFMALVPVTMEVPEAMVDPVRRVLWGEYEPAYSGERLTILDIGANVGSFSLWADMRWPASTIHAYEPHPETFAILTRNTGTRANIQRYNVAISPAPSVTSTLWSRFPGDGESGLVEYMADTFADLDRDCKFEVQLLHPAKLPLADIIKIDVEGAEADILASIDLSTASIVMLEYQNDRNRRAIKQAMPADFVLTEEDEIEWNDLLKYQNYQRSLRGDHWGHLLFVRNQSQLRPATVSASERLKTLPKLLGVSRKMRAVRFLHRLCRAFRRY